jgi:hypothetical protein
MKLYVRLESFVPLTRKRKTIYLRDKHVLEDFYQAVRTNRLDSVHVPHSDVFFVRAALRERTGQMFPLQAVEAAMRKEGWNEGRILSTDRRSKSNVD